MSIKVRNRPPEFDAMQWDGTQNGAEAVAKFASNSKFPRPFEIHAPPGNYFLVIYMGDCKTGAICMRPWWWFIKSEVGVLSPVTEADFHKQYEEIE